MEKVLDIQQAQSELPQLATYIASGRGVRILNDTQKMLLIDEDSLPTEMMDMLLETIDIEKPMDETEYLMSSPANVKKLDESIEQARQGKTRPFTGHL